MQSRRCVNPPAIIAAFLLTACGGAFGNASGQPGPMPEANGVNVQRAAARIPSQATPSLAQSSGFS
jgi:hypothetical protein